MRPGICPTHNGWIMDEVGWDYQYTKEVPRHWSGDFEVMAPRGPVRYVPVTREGVARIPGVSMLGAASAYAGRRGSSSC